MPAICPAPCHCGTAWNRFQRKLVARFGVRRALLVDRLGPYRFYCENSVEIFRSQDYGGELGSLATFLFLLQPDDVVWDVGASIGLFAVHAAALTRKVVAFEPDPATSRRLAENIELNGFAGKVHVESAALGEERGELTLYSDGLEGNAPALKAFGVHKKSVQVQVKTADGLVADGMAAPSVLKMDIEGAEILALRGARQLLRSPNAPRVLFIEVHPKFLPSFGSTPADVMKLIDDAGYQSLSIGHVHDQIHVVATKQSR